MKSVQGDDDEGYPERQPRSRGHFPKDPFLNSILLGDSQEISCGPLGAQLTLTDSSHHIWSSQPSYIQKEDHYNPSLPEMSSAYSCNASSRSSQRRIMSQSYTERPWSTSAKKNSTSSTTPCQREEKLRLVREENEMKQRQKADSLRKSERHSQDARNRKEAESRQRAERLKTQVAARHLAAEQRRQKLKLAEETKKGALMKGASTSNETKQPRPTDRAMTLSCYAGFGFAGTGIGQVEVVRQKSNCMRPVSSTGKVFGFGSSTPRPICEGNIKVRPVKVIIPEEILLKCEILARPLSHRFPQAMSTSTSGRPASCSAMRPATKPTFKKQKDKSQEAMSKKPTKDSLKDKSRNPTFSRQIRSADSTDVDSTDGLASHRDKGCHVLTMSTISANKSISANRHPKTLKDRCHSPILQSNTYSRVKRRTKKFPHADSDSIEEEAPDIQGRLSSSAVVEKVTQVEVKRDLSSTFEERLSPVTSVRASPSKDISEAEYKAKLVEVRRLMREKREREREEQIRTEKEKRHSEELAARETVERAREAMERDPEAIMHEREKSDISTKVGRTPSDQSMGDPLRPPPSELPKTEPEESPMASIQKEEEKNERKKRLDSIMNRVRKTNDQSSSEGGTSPRKSSSPEPTELRPDLTSITHVPVFRSSLLQSMMKKGRLSSMHGTTSGSQENLSLPVPPIVEREACDGKEDSPTLTEDRDASASKKIEEFTFQNASSKESSLSHISVNHKALKGISPPDTHNTDQVSQGSQ